jgi:penicillin amidase
LSYAWTALEPVRSVEADFEVIKAQNWDEFVEAATLFDAGKQNWLYADVDGNIGYVLPGLIPIRAGGDGTMPVPGWNDDYIWTGFVPYDELPKSFNPDKGYIATANNPQVRADEYEHYLGIYQDRGQRAQRIEDLIEELGDDISFEDIQRIQTDNYNYSADEVIRYLQDINFDNADLNDARDRLVAWDRQMVMDSGEAALASIYWVHLIAETYHDQLPEDLYPSGHTGDQDAFYHILQDVDNAWWDDIRTPNIVELRDEILERAFESAYEEAVDLMGDDYEKWRWGDLHRITYQNATLGRSGIGLIENIFNRGPFDTSGGVAVIQNTCWSVRSPYDVGCIPALRQVIDLGDLGNSQMIQNLGQSGHPMHRHYDDFIDPWRFFEYHPSNWDRASVESGDFDLLTLEPK